MIKLDQNVHRRPRKLAVESRNKPKQHGFSLLVSGNQTDQHSMQIEDSYPLSPLQHTMLVHSLAAPRSGAYVQQLVCKLRGELHVADFREAWESIVRRHPVFRTCFNWRLPGDPVQQVYRDVQLPFNFQDWKALPSYRRKRLLEAFLKSDRTTGFDLQHPPLLRIAVFRFSDGDYRWVWTSHHAILDGRSRLVILKELFALYRQRSNGGSLHLEKPRPYREYIDWLSRQDLEGAGKFWRDLLSGFTAPIPLGIDRASPRHFREKFTVQRVRFSEEFTRGLLDLTQQYRLTANTFLQGAWALLLARYSGEEDVVFGATRVGRHFAPGGAGSRVGIFINVVPVRVLVTPGRSLLEWLKDIRSKGVAIRDFEHTPLVEILKGSDVPSGNPLFESLVTFENYDLDNALKSDGPHDQEFRLFGAANYPLSVAGVLGRELVLNVTYDRRRFEDSAITRMLGHLETLVAAMVSRPASRLSDLPLLTEREQYQLTVEWNDTTPDYPEQQCFAELFEAQIERSPAAIAVVFEGRRLSYRELNRRANQLAHYLRELGIGPEVTVGICMERCLEMLVALLGVLKAGGAYVPLDPSLPQDRLSFMIEDSRVGVLLAAESSDPVSDPIPEAHDFIPHLGWLPSRFPHCQVVDLIGGWQNISRQSDHNLPAVSEPHNLAYILYTSGTTGRPKGVMIEQRSLVHYLHWVNREPMGGEAVNLPAITQLSFDASLKQILAPLLKGRSVWLVPEDLTADPPKLLNAIAARKPAAINTVPSLWRPLLEELKSEKRAASADSLVCLFTGGERISTQLVRSTFAALPHLEIWNLYGPTEATANATAARIKPGDEVTIGRPIANTQIYILDPQLHPVPVGVAGELHVGGAGLARGYLNRPEMTADKFVPNPFSHEPGARLYKTGDRARYRADGNIEFLDRIDNQVKIRGYRIELGEVETALSEHPAVEDAVVLARGDEVGLNRGLDNCDKRLVAYLVSKDVPGPTPAELSSFLGQKLPRYMIPSSFVVLDRFPQTSNGKVDRRALLPPSAVRLERGRTFTPARNPVERTIARIFSEVLEIQEVDIHDNFFELGGHSLMAMRVLSRIYREHGIELPVRGLFEAPTVARLARLVEAMGAVTQRPTQFAGGGEREDISL